PPQASARVAPQVRYRALSPLRTLSRSPRRAGHSRIPGRHSPARTTESLCPRRTPLEQAKQKPFSRSLKASSVITSNFRLFPRHGHRLRPAERLARLSADVRARTITRNIDT